MASTAPRIPEQYRGRTAPTASDFHVDEVATDMAGSLSPFGPEVDFPLPVEKLRYNHPTAADRPHLADGR
jgi:hypothetical protein